MVNRHLFRRLIAIALVANTMNSGTPTINQDGMNRLTTLTNARIASVTRALRFQTFLDRRRIERDHMKRNGHISLKQSFDGLLDGQHQLVVRGLVLADPLTLVFGECERQPIGTTRRPFTVVTPIRVGRQVDLGNNRAFHIRANERQRPGSSASFQIERRRPTVLGIGQA